MDDYIAEGILGGPAEMPGILAGVDSLAFNVYTSLKGILGRAMGDLDPVYVLAHLAAIAAILVITYSAAKLIDRILARYFPKVMGRSDAAANRTINALIRRLASAMVYTLGLVLVVLQIPQLQRVATAVLAGAGIVGLVIGLAAKDPLSNMVTGISLAIFQPFRIGDCIDFKGGWWVRIIENR